MKNLCDVAVIGGGPVGSYTAERLSEKGFKVWVFEQKKKIGEGVICTGLISRNSFEMFDLPFESILTKINTITFISPSGQQLEYITPQPFAYVVDRGLFDRKISERAKNNGANYFLDVYVKGVESQGRYYKLIANNTNFYARYVVIATGINYKLHKKNDFGIPPGFLYGSQIELPKRVKENNIEVYVSQEYAPGSFAWIVPRDRQNARIGVILEKNSKLFLKKFLVNRLSIGEEKFRDAYIAVKPIAYGPIKKSVSERILVVGEAAGQVKTTTGGGIFTGFLCADIAFEYLTNSLKYGKRLDGYDITWRSALSSEFEIGKKVRRVASKLNDQTIERLFSFVKNNRFFVELLLPKINFDFHSDLFYFCLKSFSYLLRIS